MHIKHWPPLPRVHTQGSAATCDGFSGKGVISNILTHSLPNFHYTSQITCPNFSLKNCARCTVKHLARAC